MAPASPPPLAQEQMSSDFVPDLTTFSVVYAAVPRARIPVSAKALRTFAQEEPTLKITVLEQPASNAV